MEMVTLGSTGITVNKNAFGALPIQRVSDEYAVMLLKKAYDNGIRYFDTARMYFSGTDSIQTVCQMPDTGVYHMPPRSVRCLP